MNTYSFFYVTEWCSEVTFTVKGRSLSQALRIFYRESENFSHPVKNLLPRYEIINSIGKWSSRLIPLKHLRIYSGILYLRLQDLEENEN